MTETSCHCSVCGTPFVPEFSYQIETAEGEGANLRYFCSLQCVGESLESQGRATCDVCGKAFIVKLAAQVVNHGGRRLHACSNPCRTQLQERHKGTNLRSLAAQARTATPSGAQSPASRAPAARATAPSELAPPPHPAGPSQSPRAVASPVPVEANGPSVTWQRISAAVRGENHAIAIFNHKGGTGKTTTAVTIAAGLAQKGRRVLLVDTDSQGNVAVSLGIEPEKSLYHVIVMGLDPASVIVPSRPNLDVLPANETLAAAELYLAGRQQRDRVLATRLAAISQNYDHVIVDCSPSLSLLNQNALVFCDAVLCPVACDYLSLVGVRQVLRTIKQVNRVLSHPVRLWGVLPTLYDSRARICAESYETLRQHFGERCLQPIRVASRAKEAPSQARTLFEYAPDSTAARDYMQVVDRLVADSQADNSEQPVAVGGNR